MNHQVKLKRTNRIAEYFVVISSTAEDLVPINDDEDNIFHITPENLTTTRFEAAILDRYPLVDRVKPDNLSANSDLPHGMEFFCLPNGLFLFNGVQKPLFHSFVHTSNDGSRKLGCCLTVFEPLSQKQKESLFQSLSKTKDLLENKLYNKINTEDESDKEIWSKIKDLHIPKCLCIISSWPFVTSFKKFLVGLYNISRLRQTTSNAYTNKKDPHEPKKQQENSTNLNLAVESALSRLMEQIPTEGTSEVTTTDGSTDNLAVQTTFFPTDTSPEYFDTTPTGLISNSSVESSQFAFDAFTSGKYNPTYDDVVQANGPIGADTAEHNHVSHAKPTTSNTTEQSMRTALDSINTDLHGISLSETNKSNNMNNGTLSSTGNAAQHSESKQQQKQLKTKPQIPIERYICNFIDDVPAPPAGKVDIIYYLQDTTLSFRCPPSNEPNVWSGLPLFPLFECLSPENICQLFALVLTERQILFVSSQYSLLTSCAEAITSLIYPLTWSHAYIPILPFNLLGVLGAPFPFILGLHTSSYTNKKECFIGDETVRVLLDENKIIYGDLGPAPPLPERRHKKLLAHIQANAPVFENRASKWSLKQTLAAVHPEKQQSALATASAATSAAATLVGGLMFSDTIKVDRYEDCVGEVQTNNITLFVTGSTDDWHLTRQPYFDDAYSSVADKCAVPISGGANGPRSAGATAQHAFNEGVVREGFLKFFVSVLKNYKKYLIYGNSENPDPLVKFQFEEFLAEHPTDWRPFVQDMIETQSFSQFVDERVLLFKLDQDVIYFDESIDAKMNRYTFKLRNIDTPFLLDSTSKHIKTYVPPSPDVSGLDELLFQSTGSESRDDDKNDSERFPRLNPALYSTPRKLIAQFDSALASQATLTQTRLKRKSTYIPPPNNCLPATSCIYSCYLIIISQIICSEMHKLTLAITQAKLMNSMPSTHTLLVEYSSRGLTDEEQAQQREIQRERMDSVDLNNSGRYRPQQSFFMANDRSLASMTGISARSTPDKMNNSSGHSANVLAGTHSSAATFTSPPAKARLRSSSLMRYNTPGKVFQSDPNRYEEYQATVKACKLALKVAFEALNCLTRMDIAAGESVFRSLADACGACGDSDSIIDLLVFMDEQGLLPDHLMLHAVVRALAGAASGGGSAEESKDADVVSTSATTAPHGRMSIFGALRRKSRGDSMDGGLTAAAHNKSAQTMSLPTETINITTNPKPRHKTISPTEVWTFTDWRSLQNNGQSSLISRVAYKAHLLKNAITPSHGRHFSSLLFGQHDSSSATVVKKPQLEPVVMRPFAKSESLAGDTTPKTPTASASAGKAKPRLSSSSSYSASSADSNATNATTSSAPLLTSGTAKSTAPVPPTKQRTLSASSPTPPALNTVPAGSGKTPPGRIGGDNGASPKPVSAATSLSPPSATAQKPQPLPYTENSYIWSTTNPLEGRVPQISWSFGNRTKNGNRTGPLTVAETINAPRKSSAPVLPTAASTTNSKLSVNNTVAKNAQNSTVFAASKKLHRHMRICEKTLTEVFPDLNVEFSNPFGTLCPNIKCTAKRPLTIGEIYQGWNNSETAGDANKYTTMCIFCNSEFIPRIKISCSYPPHQAIDTIGDSSTDDAVVFTPTKPTDKIMTFDQQPLNDTKNTTTTASNGKVNNDNGEQYTQWCELLSPWVLRKELLNILYQDGIYSLLNCYKDIIRRPDMSKRPLNGEKEGGSNGDKDATTQRSIVFWNMLIAFRLRGLPYTFLFCESVVDSFPPKNEEINAAV